MFISRIRCGLSLYQEDEENFESSKRDSHFYTCRGDSPVVYWTVLNASHCPGIADVCEPMLGIDFMVKSEVIWDFGKSTFVIANTAHILRSRSDKHRWCRRVVLQEGVSVPARFETILPTKVQFRKLPNATSQVDWSTELAQIKSGVHVSRTLVPRDVWTNVPVRILNTNNEAVFLEPELLAG